MLVNCNHLKMLVAGVCLFGAVLTNAAEIIEVKSSASNSQTILGSTVIPYKEVTVTAQMPGKITALGGEVGATFKQGDVLSKVDDSSLLAKRDTLWAQITSAQAALKNSQAQYQREIVSPRSKDISGMPGMGMPSMMDVFMTRPMYDMMGDADSDYNRYSDLMNSATGVSQAESQVRMTWSQLNELNTKINDTISIAPFEGIIMSKMVEVGDAVQPGQPLMKYGYIKYLRLKADVPSVLVPSLKNGMDVEARVGSTNKRTTARVSQIYPVADPSRHTVVVKFDLKIGYPANPGMYAEVFLPDNSPGSKLVLTIPETALIKGRSLPTVLVVNEKERKSSLRLIRRGAIQDGNVVVVSGLKEGEKIIDNPPERVSSGWYPGS